MRWGENMQAVGGWVFQKIPHFEPKYARIAKVQVVMHANIEQCCCGIISNSGLVHVSKILTGLGTFCSLDKWNATMDHFESRWNSSKNWTRPLQRLHPSMQALSTSPRSWLGLEPSAAWTSEMRNNYGCSRTLNTVWYGVVTCGMLILASARGSKNDNRKRYAFGPCCFLQVVARICWMPAQVIFLQVSFDVAYIRDKQKKRTLSNVAVAPSEVEEDSPSPVPHLQDVDWNSKMPKQSDLCKKGGINTTKVNYMFPALLILALGPDTVRIMSLSSWISSIPGLQKTSCCEYVCVCVCCLCVLTSLDLRDRRSSVSMSVTSALKSSAVFMASTWWPRNCQIQTLDFGWIANGYWNELHSSTPGLLVRFSAIIQHPEAFIQFQHSYLQMQNTWCLETIYTVVSRSNEECWKPSKPLSRFHTVCPSRKTRTRSSALQNSSLPAARSWVFDKWIKMWLPNAVHERESPEKENRLAWSSTVSLVSSHLRLKKYSFFSAWRDHLTICCMLWKKTEPALAFLTESR